MGEVEQIARDMVVALLSNGRLSANTNNPEQLGELIGKIYNVYTCKNLHNLSRLDSPSVASSQS
jgi:hypothetical protein